MKSWLEDNGIEIYSTHNKRKLVVAETFIRTLKNKSLNVWLHYRKMCILINQLMSLINTYHSTIKMKSPVVKSSTYIDFNKKNNKKATKFKAGDHVIIAKYRNIFAKGYAPNWSEEVFCY